MTIKARKHYTVTCDHTSPGGWVCLQGADIVEGEWSEYTGERTWNRGDVEHHLRKEGWTVGRTVLCPHHAPAGAA